MNSFTPGIIIACLILFLVGILVGYSLVQKRFRQQTEALKVSQRRLTEIEQSHELRLREATEKLRQDYETQLSGTIEHYQDQLSQKTVEMEQTYETRFRVLQQGRQTLAQPSASDNRSAAISGGADVAKSTGLVAGENNVPKAVPQRELMHLKRQYEIRLNEAAQKLQKSYETQLTEHVNAARADIQTEFDQQLATKYQEFEHEFATRQAELERQLEELRAESEAPPSTMASEVIPSTPSEIMGTGDETTMALASPGSSAAAMPDLEDIRYTQRELDQQIEAATQRSQADFDQRLTEQLTAQQAQFDHRLQELETEYAQRLASLEPTETSSVSDPMDAFLTEDGYEDLVSDLDSDTAVASPSIDPLEPVPDDAAASAASDALEIDDALPVEEELVEAVAAAEAVPLVITEEDLSLDDADDLSALLTTSAEANDSLTEDRQTDVNLFDDDDSPTNGDAADDLDSLLEAGTAQAVASELEAGLFDEEDGLTADLESAVGEPVEAIPSELAVDLFDEADGLTADLESAVGEPVEALPSELEVDLFDEADDLTADLESADENTETAASELEASLFGGNEFTADLEALTSDAESVGETSSELADNLFGEENLFGDAPSVPNTSVEEVDALFEDDDFLEESSEGQSDKNNDDDDDDFGPLDLSDINQLT